MSEIDWAKLELAIAQSDAKQTVTALDDVAEPAKPAADEASTEAASVSMPSPAMRRRSVTATLRSMLSKRSGKEEEAKKAVEEEPKKKDEVVEDTRRKSLTLRRRSTAGKTQMENDVLAALPQRAGDAPHLSEKALFCS